MTKYYVDQVGTYIGGFEGVDPPTGSIEVPSAPESASQVWTGSAWSASLPVPNIDQLAEDVWADPNLKAVRMQTMSFYDLLKKYLSMGELGQQRIFEAWTEDIQPQFDAVNPLLSPMIIAHAVANHIHLVPPEDEQAALSMLAAARGAQS